MNLAVVIQLLCFLVDVSEDREEGGAETNISFLNVALKLFSFWNLYKKILYLIIQKAI